MEYLYVISGLVAVAGVFAVDQKRRLRRSVCLDLYTRNCPSYCRADGVDESDNSRRRSLLSRQAGISGELPSSHAEVFAGSNDLSRRYRGIVVSGEREHAAR